MAVTRKPAFKIGEKVKVPNVGSWGADGKPKYATAEGEVVDFWHKHGQTTVTVRFANGDEEWRYEDELKRENGR